ncbi:MAG TPA: sodium:solute symporter family protein [Caldithrix abyssi]|uniref:Sodium:solute symporter family protein n=1 Tax=Caldithrix abyssi TaxID=187145 RepID=A0A7V4U3N0_CALAY|nr:sodium:solute symporter family protein [Caldithrix abyssi]
MFSAAVYYWLGFIAYSITVIAIGLYVWAKEKKQGRQNDNSEYWEAGSKLTGWSIGLSISASMMSISWSGVYGVQLFYWYGLGGAWLLIIPWLMTMAGFYIFTPMFRQFKAFSQPQLLEKRFGHSARWYLAPALIIVFITWTGAEIYAAGKIIAPLLGVSHYWTLFLISLVVAVYSYSGGFSAVVSTDKIQFALVAVFITVIAVLGFNASAEKIMNWNIPSPPRSQTNSSWLSPGIGLILITLFAYLPGWLIETDVWIRIQAARSNKAARKGILLAGFNSFLFVGLLPLMIGLSALVLFPPLNGNVPPDLEDGTLIFTNIMQNYAPLWLNIFLSVGLIAAAMSTIDTCANIVALSFSHDLLEPFLKKKWDAPKLNRLARLSSVGAVFVSFVYAVFTDSLWDIFYLSSGILTTTIFIPVIASFIPGTKRLQIKLAVVLGLSATLIFYFLETKGWISGYEPEIFSNTGLGYIIWGFLFSAAGFFIGMLSTEND